MIPIPSATRILESSSVGGRILVREWAPRDLPPSAPSVLVLHGLGDHSARHAWAAGVVARSGRRPAGFDWPGNGGSEGVRGDMPAVEESATLLEEMLERLDLHPEGVFAHSTGAFLALAWLGRRPRGLQRLGNLRWLWLSSPLVRPSHGQPAWKIALARSLARRFPRLTLGNGVRARDCYHTGLTLSAESSFAREGGHHRVSLRFATSLLAAEDGILAAAAALPTGLAYLVTHGVEDRVCPPIHAEALVRSLPGARKTCLFASGARHEPFREPEPESFANAVRAWLENV